MNPLLEKSLAEKLDWNRPPILASREVERMYDEAEEASHDQH
jgi:hypothetical protein